MLQGCKAAREDIRRWRKNMSDTKSSKVQTTQAALEDGTLLSLYKSLYLENQNQETLFSLMSCLKDAYAIVPMNTTRLSKKEADNLQNSKGSEDMDVDMEYKLEPELLQGEGMQAWLPVFSTIDEIPQDYLNEHEFVTGLVTDCIGLAHSYEELSGIVFDPFTSPMEIPFKLADLIDTVPSILELAHEADENSDKCE